MTVSVGGNDAGFADVLTECATPWWAGDCDGAIDGAQAYINNQLPGALSGLYGSIRAGAPNAQVVVVGYPRIFMGEDCNAATWFSPEEEARLNQMADLINTRTVRAGVGCGLLVREPDQRVHRARGLRQPGVAQRPVEPDQRELPPEPRRPGLRLHADRQPGADRCRVHGHRRDASVPPPANGDELAAQQRKYAARDARSSRPPSGRPT